MSKPRAKKKQRQRARAAHGSGTAAAPPGASAARAGRAERADRRASAGAEDTPREATTKPAPSRRPSRFEVRDGIPRPDAVWAPFPLTEIGMAVGIVLFLAGFASGGLRGAWLLATGIAVLSIVTSELCLREHFGGFRSHSVLLGLLPVTVLHMLVVLLVSSDWRGPLVLVVDLVLAGGLAWWLRGRFRVAQDRATRRLSG